MATMDDAVRAMAKYQLGIDLPQPEVDKIVAFLRTLTGEYKGKLLTNKNMIWQDQTEAPFHPNRASDWCKQSLRFT